jgi:hypothetical protein
MRSRRRHLFKWFGLAMCVLIASAGIGNACWNVEYERSFGMWTARIQFLVGIVHVEWGSYEGLPGVPSGGFHGADWRIRSCRSRQLRWLPRRFYTRGADLGAHCDYRSISFPIWLPLVAVTIPTAILWHRDRRPRPGHCSTCGYNLTGNLSGICPECGCATESLGKEDCDMGP